MGFGTNPIAQVLLNNGDGAFAAPLTFTGWAPGASLAVGDLDGDGFPDVVYASANYNDVAVFMHLGVFRGVWRGLSAPEAISTGNSPTSPVIGDFDGDIGPNFYATQSWANAETGICARAEGAAVVVHPLTVYPLKSEWVGQQPSAHR